MTQAHSALFDGKVATVIGGATGIGRAITEALLNRGATVYIGGRNVDVGEQTAHETGAHYRPIDVRSSGSVADFFGGVAQTEDQIDFSVHSAGTRLGKPAEETTDEEWIEVFDINTTGVFRCCREVGRIMLARDAGSIVNVASMSARVVNTPQKQSTYNASKAAVVQYTKSLAAEWAPRGIRVNSVSPGYTVTNMTAASRSKPELTRVWLERTPLGRMAQPVEIGGAAAYLLSDEASYVTGHDLVIDGGYSVW